MNRLKSVSLGIAKVAAVTVAVFTLGCFVWKAQSDANPEPAGEPSTEAATPAEPQRPVDATVTPPPTFLPSSKSLVLEMEEQPGQREPTLIFSSKSAVLIEPAPAPGSAAEQRVFLPSSKSGRPIQAPPQQKTQ